MRNRLIAGPRREAAARRAGAALLVLLLGLGAAAPATADDIDDRRAAAEQNARQKQAERTDLQENLEETNGKLAQAVLDLNAVEARLPLAQAELDRAVADLEKAQREAAVLAQRLQDAQAEEAEITAQIAADAGKVDAARAEIVQMAREAARGTGNVTAMGLVTGVESTEEFLRVHAVEESAARSQSRALADLQDAEAVARNQQARLAAIRDTITQLKAAADAKVAEAKVAEKAAADRKAEVQGLIAQQRTLKATIEKQKVAAEQEIVENDRQRKKLESDIQAIIGEQKERDARIAEQRRKEEEARQAEATRRAAAAAQGGGGGGDPAPAPAAPPSSSSFLHYPTAVPHVTSNYGMRFHPVLKIWRLHAGTDFRAYCGTPVFAAQSGFVEQAHYTSGGGNNILINHGSDGGANIMTRYLHLSSMAVGVGQWVSQGQQVGLSGNTGTSAACHLHFEVWVNGSTVDPLTRLP